MIERNALSPKVFPEPWAGEWGEDEFGLWQALVYNEVKQVFRWIPPGDFWVGSPDNELGRFNNEVHFFTEHIRNGFWLGETVVTQAFWQAVMGYNPSKFSGDLRPVEQLAWEEVMRFIGVLNDLNPHLSTRLPDEYEWEYACRAGSETPFNFGSELSLQRANYCGNWDYEANVNNPEAVGSTVEVKSYPCNAWGLYEMHGNVWEWCQDEWAEPFGVRSNSRRIAQFAKQIRVVRGGAWSSIGRFLRSAAMSSDEDAPDGRSSAIGFRLAIGMLNDPNDVSFLQTAVAEAE